MRASLFALLLTAAPFAASHAQASPGDRAQILSLEDRWASSLVKRDKQYFTATLAPGFVYTEDAVLSTREQVLHDLVVPTDTVLSAHNEDMVVHLFGATAAVTGLLVVDGRAKGVHYHHRYRFTDTWVKQPDKRWKIVAAQDYLIPAGT